MVSISSLFECIRWETNPFMITFSKHPVLDQSRASSGPELTHCWMFTGPYLLDAPLKYYVFQVFQTTHYWPVPWDSPVLMSYLTNLSHDITVGVIKLLCLGVRWESSLTMRGLQELISAWRFLFSCVHRGRYCHLLYISSNKMCWPHCHMPEPDAWCSLSVFSYEWGLRYAFDSLIDWLSTV